MNVKSRYNHICQFCPSGTEVLSLPLSTLFPYHSINCPPLPKHRMQLPPFSTLRSHNPPSNLIKSDHPTIGSHSSLTSGIPLLLPSVRLHLPHIISTVLTGVDLRHSVPKITYPLWPVPCLIPPGDWINCQYAGSYRSRVHLHQTNMHR